MLIEAKNYMISRLHWVLFQTLGLVSGAIAVQLSWDSQSLTRTRKASARELPEMALLHCSAALGCHCQIQSFHLDTPGRVSLRKNMV